MVAAISATSDDGLKLLLLVAIGGGLLALGRWSSRLGGPRIGDLYIDTPTSDVKELVPDTQAAKKVWPTSAEEVAASLPFDPSLGKIRIRKFFFKKADAIPGPDDPEVFADELNLELYDPDSGHAWWQSYFVATPQGLAKILREKSWRYLHAPEILVFPQYNLEEIRRAVVSRIVADNEYFKGKGQAEEESL
ncbi:MAG TPA: hypothetical protein VE377_00855 [Candidatus Dormibacteraeota bacterium]|nr:hypothetical protein [Candidatus Dormibacteraeota bacterium]